MSLLDDMFGRPTDGEKDLRQITASAMSHAQELDEQLDIIDPREATDQGVHSQVCYRRQIAAKAWRKAMALQGQLNGAENRRYSRSLACWMVVGCSANLLKGVIPLETIGKALVFLAGLG